MATSFFEEKSRFIKFTEDVIGNRKTALVSISTESGRSVLLKFSLGVLIYSYSRNIGIREVIKFINESDRVKFDIAPILVEEGIEILSSTLLLKLLQLEKHLEQEADTRQRGGSGSNLQL